jgi:hypothetical protein
MHGGANRRNGEVGESGEEKDLGQLTKEQSDVVIAMLREQLKYERERNRELKNRVEFKDGQVESLEKQVHAMDKHADLTTKIINKQKMEIERMKMEINRIGLFRNLLSKNVPNGVGHSHAGGIAQDFPADDHTAGYGADSHQEGVDPITNGHVSPVQDFPFLVKDEPIE